MSPPVHPKTSNWRQGCSYSAWFAPIMLYLLGVGVGRGLLALRTRALHPYLNKPGFCYQGRREAMALGQRLPPFFFEALLLPSFGALESLNLGVGVGRGVCLCKYFWCPKEAHVQFLTYRCTLEFSEPCPSLWITILVLEAFLGLFFQKKPFGFVALFEAIVSHWLNWAHLPEWISLDVLQLNNAGSSPFS